MRSRCHDGDGVHASAAAGHGRARSRGKLKLDWKLCPEYLARYVVLEAEYTVHVHTGTDV